MDEQREREQDNRLERIERKLEFICQHLTGGLQPERGIIVRIDRMEQAERQRAKVVASAVYAAAIASASAVASWIARLF